VSDSETATVRLAHAAEVEQGERFAFGENWARFLEVLDEERILEAERSLEAMLGPGALSGASFLDIGCGSGLFSLAALRLGARRVHSFDFDPSSVACAQALRQRFAPADRTWTVGVGSALDADYLASLGGFDVVYSWGVLHHTGSMWAALDQAARRVAPGGALFISIYNDQGFRSRVWAVVKRTYNRLPRRPRTAFAVIVMAPYELASVARWTARGRPWRYVQTWTRYQRTRGMSRWHDLVDWVGGYPFEVAAPAAVVDACRPHGLVLERLVPTRGLGCNEFVFRRPSP
jgi:2-polyprenyl-3-methyl-5-hydroxy-6-metoxy-1,4-benzoquinol methylase